MQIIGMLNKFFNSTFDFFSHALPGVIVVGVLLLFHPNINSTDDLVKFVNVTKPPTWIFVLILGYIIGFAIHPLGRQIYKYIGFKIWDKKIENDINMPIYDKYVTIREHCPSNFKYVEIWNMYSAMAHNLAFSSIVLFIASIYRAFRIPSDTLFWGIMAVFSVITFFLFINRAVVFYRWAALDMNAAIRQLDMSKANQNI